MVLDDGLTRSDEVVLRKGSGYTSTSVMNFIKPVLFSLRRAYRGATILVRGDSGFAFPQLYDLCEEYGVHYLFKLKANATLRTVFIKIAVKTVSLAKKMRMRLCSSVPYKEAILKILENIHLLDLV